MVWPIASRHATPVPAAAQGGCELPDASIRESSPSTSVRIVACVGYALLLFSCHLTVWGGLQLTDRTGLALIPLLSWWTVPLLLAMGAVQLALGALVFLHPLVAGEGQGRRVAIRVASCVGCAAVLAGYGLVVVGPPASVSSVFPGGMVLGAGMGLLFVAWAAVLARFSVRDVTTLVLVALIVYAALALVAGYLPLPVLETAFVLSAVGSTAVLLTVAIRMRSKGEDRVPRSPSSAPDGFSWIRPQGVGGLARDALVAVRNPLFCATATAFAVAITRTMTLSSRPDAVGAAGALCLAIGAAASLAALRRRRGSQAAWLTIPALFRIMFPLVATLLLAFPIGGEGFEQVAGAAVFAVYIIVSVLMVPACIDTAQRKGLRVAAVYGLFTGIVHLAFSGATFLGVRLFAEGGGFGATTSLVATLLVLYVLAMAYALVQRRARGAGSSLGVAGDADSDDGASASAEGIEGDAAALEASPSDLPDPIEQRCLILVERFGLSPRETEVLLAFAHGRNVSYLAEQLCLSPNTIRSHSKTLYTKLGVHSKQELLNLVENAEEPS